MSEQAADGRSERQKRLLEEMVELVKGLDDAKLGACCMVENRAVLKSLLEFAGDDTIRLTRPGLSGERYFLVSVRTNGDFSMTLGVRGQGVMATALTADLAHVSSMARRFIVELADPPGPG